MRKPIVAALAVFASFAVLPGLASGQGFDNTTGLPSGCTRLKTIYSEKNWRDATPLNGRHPCSRNKAVVEHFKLYRHYRQIATIHCPGGLRGEHYWVKPCAVVECESEPDYSWGSQNPSGATDPYQLMPEWGPPWPVRTFAQRVRVHEIAAPLSLSNWRASESCWG